jgi:hypothetical protein
MTTFGSVNLDRAMRANTSGDRTGGAPATHTGPPNACVAPPESL